MGWNTANVHRLAGFAAAKLWHDRTKPIRGHKDNVRPLGSRRHHIMADIHMPDENTVQLRYYGETLVEWRSDDTYSVYPPKYFSAYVPDNIHHFLPCAGQGFRWSRGRMFYVDHNEVYELKRKGSSLEFQFVNGRSYMLNAPVAYNIRAKRNALAKVLPRYEGFLSWAQVVLAVTDNFTHEETGPSVDRFAVNLGYKSAQEYQALWGRPDLQQAERDELWEERYVREALPFGYGYHDHHRGVGYNPTACKRVQEMMLSNNSEDWVDVLHICASQAGRHVWRPLNGLMLNPVTCFKWVSALVTYLHRDELFDKVRLPKGAMPSRTNTKFFRENFFTPWNIRHGVDSSSAN